MDVDELETFSVLQYGPAMAFLNLVRNSGYPNQVAEYLGVLAREGKLVDFAKRLLDANAKKDDPHEEIVALRERFAYDFVVDKVSGRIGLGKKPFDLVSVGPGMPFLGRDKIRNRMRKLLSGDARTKNVMDLAGASGIGKSYVGVYLAELGRQLALYRIISVDFKRDLPVSPDEQITAVHLADTISRRVDGLEEYHNMYRDRPDDFKLSSFTQSLIRQLQKSDELHLFFFDHLHYVPLTDSVQDMIVYLADSIARPDTPGVVVTSGLALRPQDEVFGDVGVIGLGKITYQQVLKYFNYLYDAISTAEARADQAAKLAFLQRAMKPLPKDFFADETQATVAEISARCRMMTDILIDGGEEGTDDIEEPGLILDLHG